ncbi:uncharacterized protein LOC135495877 [Lineus longissimus]|uniref:uncharacterized protein LOC135495877 n=1 Tax=Lineus longissimus TaxID=88925 RepID=UPI00315DB120
MFLQQESRRLADELQHMQTQLQALSDSRQRASRDWISSRWASTPIPPQPNFSSVEATCSKARCTMPTAEATAHAVDINTGIDPPQCRTPPVLPARDPSPTNHEKSADSGFDLSKAISTLADVLVRRGEGLPKKEPEVFKGDIFSYPSWKNSFNVLVEGRYPSAMDRLYYLGRYTAGDAKRCIKGLLDLNTCEAYAKAKQILEERFGDRLKLSENFRNRLDKWPSVKPGDGKGMQELSDFLCECETAMTSLSNLSILNDAIEQRRVIDKLPRFMQERWLTVVDKWRFGADSDGSGQVVNDSYPPFSRLVQFVKKHARIMSNPILDRSSSAPTKSVVSVKPAQRSSFATGTETITEKATGPTKCVLCPKDNTHAIDSCVKFKNMSLSDRKEAVKKHGLCLGCLKWGHRVRDCKSKHKCKTCSRAHPTLLHDDSFKPVESTVHCTESSDVGSECLHTMIVPVYVYHVDDPSREVLVYTLLDDQSDTCFVSESVLEGIDKRGDSTYLKINTVLAEGVVPAERVTGLMVRGFGESAKISLPVVFSRKGIGACRSQIPRQTSAKQWRHLKGVAPKIMPYREDIEIGMLIGQNCARAIRPRQIVAGGEDDPYGVKTALGWGVVGRMDKLGSRLANSQDRFVYRTRTKEINPSDILQVLGQDFADTNDVDSHSLSVEDRLFIEKVSSGIKLRDDGHFEIPLPFREDQVRLPNNRVMAMKRTQSLKARIRKDAKYGEEYVKFMSKLIDAGQAERVPENELDLDNGSVWYIPHHMVSHPHKEGKYRVVFDCAASYQGEALNGHLLRGPDLINNLVGVLARFRKEEVAFTCDVQGMFLQVVVPPRHRNYLRFLWWEDGDVSKEPVDYRCTVHLFGATSSANCANYALKATAERFKDDYEPQVATFFNRNFYVDDGATSVLTTSQAISLALGSVSMAGKGGFTLHKILCNNKEVLKHIPNQYLSENLQCLELGNTQLPVEKTLGVVWCVESDMLRFRVEIKDKPLTRRGLLSTVSSIYDPLGLISPFILTGKRILKELCLSGSSWDDPLPDNVRNEWERWRTELLELPKVSIPRCYRAGTLEGPVTNVELHHFSDACFSGYGQCSYVRLEDATGNCTTSLVMAKSRVTPAKAVTIPRLELTAALLSARVGKFLGKELDYDQIEHFYYTDSMVVLGYVNNESRNFHIFVANRVQEIRDLTNIANWRHVDTAQNPADMASRGMNVSELSASRLWWQGPEFLVSGPVPTLPECPVVKDDPELKKFVFKTDVVPVPEVPDMESRFANFSSLLKLKRAMAVSMKYARKLKNKDPDTCPPVTTDDLKQAEDQIIRLVQGKAYPEELASLSKGTRSAVKAGSKIAPLDPFLDDKGIIRVGGRLSRSSMSYEVKHPVLIPRTCHLASLIVKRFHQKVGHSGRGMTLNSIRQAGFWIVNARSIVAKFIMGCVCCRKLRGNPCVQKMSDLPTDRLEPAAPFSYAAVDLFGPYTVKSGRSEPKRWGVMFTCLASRAIHIETANQLTTDSFLNAYRRCVSRRGKIRFLRCDRGSNFVGGQNQLLAALQEMDRDKIKHELLKDDCDWVDFEMNFPVSSHMGGVWERMIGAARKVLSALLMGTGAQLDDELLRTLLCEVEYIVNSRPLTVVDSTSADLEPLSPIQLLTLKSQVVKPPPGKFVKQDIYSKKRWRCVQALANQFWERWRGEFLVMLQPRKKWLSQQRNLEPGDVVMLVEEGQPRCAWPLARVTKVCPSQDKLVRKVEIFVGKTKSLLDRPVHKLILLVKNRDNPVEESETLE